MGNHCLLSEEKKIFINYNRFQIAYFTLVSKILFINNPSSDPGNPKSQ